MGEQGLSISGAFVALVDAINKLHRKTFQIYQLNFFTATSVGIVNGEKLLDLCYEEDSNAKVDEYSINR